MKDITTYITEAAKFDYWKDIIEFPGYELKVSKKYITNQVLIMKNIIEYINEASDVKVKFQGQEFTMDRMILSNVHHDLQMASEVDSFTEDMWKDLKKQGVKYILTIPPHYYSGDAKNDIFTIKMFIKGKKIHDMYEHSEAYALYDVKTHECINKDIMQKGRAYKVIRFE